MKKMMFTAMLAIAFLTNISAQKYFTRDGKVSFFSDTPMEKIEAHNQKATSVLDTESGRLEFAVLVKAFQFEKALMQEHFNENYMESTKFPKATFKGQIQDQAAVKFNADGEYPVKVAGEMTIHGVSRNIEVPGKITVKNGQISASSSFEVDVADYQISIPSVVRDKIAKTVRIDVAVAYEPLKS